MTQKIAPRPSLTDSVAVALGDEIVSGSYKVGDGLRSENELSKAFGVSRTVMREAISRLKAEGLIDSRQGSGYYVRACERQAAFNIGSGVADDISKVLPIVAFRRGFEVEAAGLAARLATESDLAKIRGAFDRMQDALDNHDLAAGIEADFEFHMGICEATQNIYFPKLFQTFRGFLFETLKISRANSAYRLHSETPAQAEHAALLDAITAGEVATARIAAAHHIDNTLLRLQASLPAPEALERSLARDPVGSNDK